MIDEPIRKLGGEADHNSWRFTRLNGDEPLSHARGHTFPLLSHDEDGRWRLIGTGFYISDTGLFVTAKHVINEVLFDGRQTLPLAILQLNCPAGPFGPFEFQLRPIMQCWLSDAADVALGVAATATNKSTGEELSNLTWTLSRSVPNVGAGVSTYAFPNHAIANDGRKIFFSPDAYSGHLLGCGDFRDRVMVPYPYVEVDFRIHGAASGGPIISEGRVIGINCTEWPENLDHPPGPGFGAQIKCLEGSFLEDVVLPPEEKPRRVTYDELIAAGSITIENYNPAHERECLVGTVVRLDIPITAPRPEIETAEYF